MSSSLSVKILPYEYVAPEGFLITPSGGYVFYSSRIDYLREGRTPVFNPATGLTPGNRLSNFRSNPFSRRPASSNITQSMGPEENENYQHEGKPVKSTFYQLDMHRWVNTQIQKNQSFKTTDIPLSEIAEGSKAFEQTVRGFATKYGDFFTSNVHSDSFQENRLDDWFGEWKIIGNAAMDAQSEEGKQRLTKAVPEGKSILNSNLYKYTGIGDYHGGWSGERPPGGGVRARIFRPINLVGLCWALIARDISDDITYSRCKNYQSTENPNGCEHEIPSITLDGKTGVEYCSRKCSEGS